MWTDGATVEYINWGDEEPSDGNCVEVSHQSGKWATVDCGNNKNWVCKIRKGEVIILYIYKFLLPFDKFTKLKVS